MGLLFYLEHVETDLEFLRNQEILFCKIKLWNEEKIHRKDRFRCAVTWTTLNHRSAPSFVTFESWEGN